jgi:uncharacterized membrane protein
MILAEHRGQIIQKAPPGKAMGRMETEFITGGGSPFERGGAALTVPEVSSIKARGMVPKEAAMMDQDLDEPGEGAPGPSREDEEDPGEEREAESLQAELPLTDHDRILLVLSYLGILALVPYLTARKLFVIWHARQGLLLFGVSLVSLFCMILANVILWHFSWVLGVLFLILLLTSAFGVLALIVACILKAFEGERWRIPFLGDWVDRI